MKSNEQLSDKISLLDNIDEAMQSLLLTKEPPFVKGGGASGYDANSSKQRMNKSLEKH